MADPSVEVRLIHGAITRADGLCPHCWSAALWAHNVYAWRDTAEGPRINNVGRITFCRPCARPVRPA